MQNQEREQWGSRAGFLMAAIGSAIGLGNIWRFPAEAYKNGGGAFLLPYLIALLTAGLPLLILEYTIGRRFRKSPPAAFRQLTRPAEAIGWWQVAICFVIASYYAVIVAWAVRYAGFSFGKDWGKEPEKFFSSDFLHSAPDVGLPSSWVGGVFWPLLAVWVIVLVILGLGVRKGIERANKIFIPLLVVFFVVLVVRAVTLDGAAKGLDALFSPDWGQLTNGSVWVAAYGQIFFSLSIGFGIMVTYASYLPRRADLTNSALVAGFANSSFEILAGIGVFSTLGFMAQAQGVGIDKVVTDGVGLAFIAFPAIISEMPAGALFGVLFFVSLAIAGLTSLISIVQVIISAVQDRTGARRVPVVAVVGGFSAVVSLLVFPTDVGLAILDSCDHFINQYGIALAALVFLVVVGWVLRRLHQFQAHADETSAVKLGLWWRVCLGVITPIVLGWMMVDSLRAEFEENYGGYSTTFLGWAGWGVAGGALLVGVVLAFIPWRDAPDSDVEKTDAAGNPRATEADNAGEVH
ncbi:MULTISPECIES: sodium-dependent transporter [Streptomyces]|uniref:sodium-dependent transporter n=1 Tax=Streptomyces TaxID=1883 RepID=UPI00068EB70C|nr:MULTISPECIES: sodium-dependent transporter [Streptomyces]NNG89267.1 sodium-dependent transporter [Streptomyces cacaoi]QHF98357.1 sodium-dependent transporter [Streptomyces sp. NHF165]